MRRCLSVLFLLLAYVGAAFGQAASVQQTTTRLDAATNVLYATATAGSPAVATILGVGGQYAYITSINFDICTTAGGPTVITNALFTSSNIGVGAVSPSWQVSYPGTVNTCAVPYRESYPNPVKSLAPGTNVVITSPTTANTIYAIRIYYYVAP